MNKQRAIWSGILVAVASGCVLVTYSVMSAQPPREAAMSAGEATSVNAIGWLGGLLTSVGGVGGVWKIIQGTLIARKDPTDLVMDLLSQALARSLDPDVEAVMVRFATHVLNNAPNSVTGQFSVSLLGSVLAERSAPEAVRTAFSVVSDFVNAAPPKA